MAHARSNGVNGVSAEATNVEVLEITHGSIAVLGYRIDTSLFLAGLQLFEALLRLPCFSEDEAIANCEDIATVCLRFLVDEHTKLQLLFVLG